MVMVEKLHKLVPICEVGSNGYIIQRLPAEGAEATETYHVNGSFLNDFRQEGAFHEGHWVKHVSVSPMDSEGNIFPQKIKLPPEELVVAIDRQ